MGLDNPKEDVNTHTRIKKLWEMLTSQKLIQKRKTRIRYSYEDELDETWYLLNRFYNFFIMHTFQR